MKVRTTRGYLMFPLEGIVVGLAAWQAWGWEAGVVAGSAAAALCGISDHLSMLAEVLERLYWDHVDRNRG